MMPGMVIKKAGFLTTVQDAGRKGAQNLGFPASGWLDQPAAELGNLLVGNELDTAALEYGLVGPKIEFQVSTFIAITGAPTQVYLNQQPLAQSQAVRVQPGDELTIGQLKRGRWGYLAVAGGFQLPKILGSLATTTRLKIGGFHGRQLQANDELLIQSRTTLPYYTVRKIAALELSNESKLTIRVTSGPQYQQFSEQQQSLFTKQTYQLTEQSDRMGYRLQGTPLKTGEANMLSEATVLGGVQISADGQPIVLLADRQTTGGYPVIAVVVKADLPKLIQAMPGEQIQFEMISLATARTLAQQELLKLKELKKRIHEQRYQGPVRYTRITAQRVENLFQDSQE